MKKENLNKLDVDGKYWWTTKNWRKMIDAGRWSNPKMEATLTTY